MILYCFYVSNIVFHFIFVCHNMICSLYVRGYFTCRFVQGSKRTNKKGKFAKYYSGLLSPLTCLFVGPRKSQKAGPIFLLAASSQTGKQTFSL
jgi:hypothetical protein